MSSSAGKNGKNRRCTQHKTAAPATPGAGEHKAGNNTAWDRRIWRVSYASFILGCVWILLFPLVTVTTGESKPRGTFFDENALLVHHTSTKLTASDVDWAKPARLREAYPQQVNCAVWQLGGRASILDCNRSHDYSCVSSLSRQLFGMPFKFILVLVYTRASGVTCMTSYIQLCNVHVCPVAFDSNDMPGLIVQDGVAGAEWVCTVLRGMDLPCYTHSFYERPTSQSGLRNRYEAGHRDAHTCRVTFWVFGSSVLRNWGRWKG